MAVEHLARIALQNIDSAAPGAYYGVADGLSLGAGVIYSGVTFPAYNAVERQFEIIEDGIALVLTNECDIANERVFNTHLLVCPIMTIKAFHEAFIRTLGLDRAVTLIQHIAQNVVYRVFYLPPAAELLGIGELEFGGLLYLNHICSTHVSLFDENGARQVGALSTYGMGRVDQKLTNHLLRPKAELLPRTS